MTVFMCVTGNALFWMQVVTMVHKEYEKALEGIKRSYQNTSGVLQKPKLVPVQRSKDHTNQKIPRIYREVGEDYTSPSRSPHREEEIVEVIPPTNPYGDTHNLLKFYTIGPSQVGFSTCFRVMLLDCPQVMMVVYT